MLAARSVAVRLAPPLAALAVAAAIYAPMVADPYATGYGDYQAYHHNWEAGRVAIQSDHQWPLWNPYECGGITTFGNADSQLYHPLFLVSLVLGTTVALKIFVLLHAAAGVLGMWIFARRAERLGPVASALAAIAWCASGYFAWHCGVGHAGFLPFYLLPWLVLAWRRAMTRPRWSVAVAAVMVLALLGAGIYPFTFFALVIGYEAIPVLARADRRTTVLRAGLLSIALTALLGGVRLLPIVEHLGYFPREISENDSLPVSQIVSVLTGRVRGWQRPWAGHHWTWPEYDVFVGWGVVVLGALGAIVAAKAWRRRGRLLGGALLFGSLSLGSGGALHPWSILRRFPIFDSLQVPTRLAIVFLFYFSLLAALAVDLAWRRAVAAPLRTRRIAQVAIAVLAAFAALDVAVEHVRILSDKWNEPSVDVVPTAARRTSVFRIATAPTRPQRSPNPSNASLPSWNLGTAWCYTGMNYIGAAGLWKGFVPQVRTPGTPSEIRAWGRTALSAWADVVLDRPGRVVFNQTWSPGWRASVGRLHEVARQPVVDLPAGRRRVEISYRPKTLWPALGLTLAGLAACAFVWRLRTRAALARLGRIHLFSPIAIATTAIGLVYLVALR